jgi:hypothetical protein
MNIISSERVVQRTWVMLLVFGLNHCFGMQCLARPKGCGWRATWGRGRHNEPWIRNIEGSDPCPKDTCHRSSCSFDSDNWVESVRVRWIWYRLCKLHHIALIVQCLWASFFFRMIIHQIKVQSYCIWVLPTSMQSLRHDSAHASSSSNDRATCRGARLFLMQTLHVTLSGRECFQDANRKGLFILDVLRFV